jgi:hypothetical protein
MIKNASRDRLEARQNGLYLGQHRTVTVFFISVGSQGGKEPLPATLPSEWVFWCNFEFSGFIF